MTRSLALLGLTVGVLALGLELDSSGLLIVGTLLILLSAWSTATTIAVAFDEWRRGRRMPRDDHPEIAAVLRGGRGTGHPAAVRHMTATALFMPPFRDDAHRQRYIDHVNRNTH